MVKLEEKELHFIIPTKTIKNDTSDLGRVTLTLEFDIWEAGSAFGQPLALVACSPRMSDEERESMKSLSNSRRKVA